MNSDPDIDTLSDRQHVADLFTKYSEAVDGKDWELYRSLFADGALIDYAGAYGRVGTIDEIAPWMTSLMTEQFVPETMHAITNVSVDLRGDEASASAYYLNPDVMSFGEDGFKLLFNGGRYRATCRRTQNGWRFTSFVAKVVFSMTHELASFELSDDKA